MTGRVANFVRAMALVFVVPLIALGISMAVSSEYDSEFRQGLLQYAQQNGEQIDLAKVANYREVCSQDRPELSEICAPAGELQIFENGAKISIYVGCLLFVILLSGRFYAGSNKTRLAHILSPLTRTVLIILSGSIVLQGALFVYGIYIAEAVFIHRVHFVALAGAGFAALIGGISLVTIAIRIMKEEVLHLDAILIDSNNGNGLISLVNDVADNVGASRPDNIVVGLQPNFFVTGTKVALMGSEDGLDGTTLFLPLPFLNILDEIELRSVLGHEMGHFKGKDLEYSLKFYPAYSRISSAIAWLAGDGESSHLVNLPTAAFLALVHGEFSGVERKIGREREVIADQEGAKVGSPMGLARALLKFSEYAQLWGGVRKLNVDMLNDGKIYDDLSELFQSVVQKTYQETDFETRRDYLLAFEMAHPNDTHPTLSERLLALGIDADSLNKEDLRPSDEIVSKLLPGYESIANALTVREHRVMIGYGYASIPPASIQ